MKIQRLYLDFPMTSSGFIAGRTWHMDVTSSASKGRVCRSGLSVGGAKLKVEVEQLSQWSRSPCRHYCNAELSWFPTETGTKVGIRASIAVDSKTPRGLR